MIDLLNRHRKLVLAFIDASIIIVIFILSVLIFDIRYGPGSIIFNIPILVRIGILLLCYIPVFTFSSMYHTLWRYTRLRSIIICFVSGLTGGFIYMTVIGIYSQYANFPFVYSFHFFRLFATAIALTSLRIIYYFFYRIMVIEMNRPCDNIESFVKGLDLHEQHPKTKDSDQVYSTNFRLMIIGAGEGTLLLLNEIAQQKKRIYDPICIIDDDIQKVNRSLRGVNIVGATKNIEEMVSKYNIQIILLCIPAIDAINKKRILEICSRTDCKILIVPAVEELDKNRGIAQSLREIKIEDLLGRKSVMLENDKISESIKDKVVLVTGGGGSIGSELCRQIVEICPAKLVVFEIYENNAYDLQQELLIKYGDKANVEVVIGSIRDEGRLDKVFAHFKPNIVFHAAAHKHVPLMENAPIEAVKNNVFGSVNVMKASVNHGVEKFILISTDKAVNPTSIMGATKRCAELIMTILAKKSKTNFCAVRFGNVLGSNGSVVPLFKKQIEMGGPVTLTHEDIIRYFMTIPEAVSLVLQAATMAENGEIFVLDMGEPVKIRDLAERLIKLAGLDPGVDIEIKVTGLRPGEKLYEELLLTEEGIGKTHNDRIYIAKTSDIDIEDFASKISSLKELVDSDIEAEKVFDAMKDLIPSYTRKTNDFSK